MLKSHNIKLLPATAKTVHTQMRHSLKAIRCGKEDSSRFFRIFKNYLNLYLTPKLSRTMVRLLLISLLLTGMPSVPEHERISNDEVTLTSLLREIAAKRA